ncbi:hypothetical protein PTT_06958 [Pyrenophora teres f. teres 0-1]|uniref:Uncharacterized protein n=1 Tax=Pyrenophora teres f. teres (strain 0-1) TaxID=861557 RepID=E3RGM1_PYRTT|nr:hypothetical protein PTT_06958 [Pyrenophora teres f. teres 0-1]
MRPASYSTTGVVAIASGAAQRRSSLRLSSASGGRATLNPCSRAASHITARAPATSGGQRPRVWD